MKAGISKVAPITQRQQKGTKINNKGGTVVRAGVQRARPRKG